MPGPSRLSELPLPKRADPPAAKPPPRFEAASFEGFRPGNDSQRDACAAVRDFVAELPLPRGGLRLPWSKPAQGKGLYLDGGYGVGKTHLLAAAYHACSVRRAYLTFQELVYRIGALGTERAQQEFAGVRLLCLDEFELDDPGNTLVVKRFLERLFVAGGSVITTSNTPPEAQGRGRFNAQDFKREIQGIASRFEVVNIEGHDYRRRERPASLLSREALEGQLSGAAKNDARLYTAEFEELLEVLRELHPIRYRPLLAAIDILFVSGVRTIAGQNDALRFVHFIDQLYDMRVGFRASGAVELGALFDSSYRQGAYGRKYERCTSRLAELIEEPLPLESGSWSNSRIDRAQGSD